MTISTKEKELQKRADELVEEHKRIINEIIAEREKRLSINTIDRTGEAVCDECNTLLVEDFIAKSDFVVKHSRTWCPDCKRKYLKRTKKFDSEYKEGQRIDEDWLKQPILIISEGK